MRERTDDERDAAAEEFYREPALVYCERCGLKVPERLASFDVGVRGGIAGRCAACRPLAGPEGEAKHAEVIALRKAKLNGRA